MGLNTSHNNINTNFPVCEASLPLLLKMLNLTHKNMSTCTMCVLFCATNNVCAREHNNRKRQSSFPDQV